jgi:hypothetical protein
MFQDIPQSDSQRIILPLDKWMGKVDSTTALYSKDCDIKDKQILDKTEEFITKLSQKINYKVTRLSFIEEMDRIFLEICFIFDILLVALAMDALFGGIKTYMIILFICIVSLYLVGKIGVLIFPEIIYTIAVDCGCYQDMTKKSDILEVIQEYKEFFAKHGIRWDIGRNCAWIELWMDFKNVVWQNMNASSMGTTAGRSKKDD